MKLRGLAKRVSSGLFRAGDRLGVHVLPAHYYSPVANRRWLRKHEPLWRKPATLRGIRWDLTAQGEWLTETAAAYPAEVPLRRIYAEAERVGGFRYGPIEAQMLHAVIRSKAPARILEIGSGSTTLIMSRAAGMNEAEGRPASTITAVDPFAGEALDSLDHVTVRREGGLEVSGEELGLAAGDLLFIDSTHAVRTGSEVSHLYLELLPQLPPGVLVHIHDIFLPYLYPPHLYSEFFDWQETTLVAALLVNNDQLGVLASMAGLHAEAPGILSTAFPEYRPRRMSGGLYLEGDEDGHFPSALWLRSGGD